MTVARFRNAECALASMNAGGLFQLEKCRYETGVHTQSGDPPKAFTAVQSRAGILLGA